MKSVVITDQFDPDGEACGVIRLTGDDCVMDFPYDDSSERADQLRNARYDAEQAYDNITDLTDTYISEPQ